jgi:hypothetical protein
MKRDVRPNFVIIKTYFLGFFQVQNCDPSQEKQDKLSLPIWHLCFLHICLAFEKKLQNAAEIIVFSVQSCQTLNE